MAFCRSFCCGCCRTLCSAITLQKGHFEASQFESHPLLTMVWPVVNNESMAIMCFKPSGIQECLDKLICIPLPIASSCDSAITKLTKVTTRRECRALVPK